MNLKMLSKSCNYHPQQQYVALCMNQSCLHFKLGCAKCLVFFHSNHSQSILFLDDILNNKTKLIKAWNCPKTIQSIIKYNEQRQIIQEQLSKLQYDLQKKIYQQIDNTKEKVRQQQIIIRSEIQKKIQNIKYQNRIGFQISYIQSIIKLFKKNMISESQYFSQLDKIIKNRNNIQSILEQKIKIPSVNLNKDLLQEKQQEIIGKLKQMNKIIKIHSKIFEFKPASKQLRCLFSLISKYIKEIEKGKIFEFSQQYDNQIIYGPILKNQDVRFSIKIEAILQQKQENRQIIRKKNTKKMQLANCDQQYEQELQQIVQHPNNAKSMEKSRFANAIHNFNIEQYKNLKNLFIGIVNDEVKNDQKSYIHEGSVRPKKFSQLINHGYDIIQGNVIGGLLNLSKYNVNGQYNTKDMSTVFYEKINSKDFQLFFNWDGYNKFLSIEQKDRQAKLECNLSHRILQSLRDQFYLQNPIQIRPYICCNKSKVCITIQGKEIKNVEKTNSKMQF